MKTSSNKILTIAVVLLLLVNIAMLVFMFRGKKSHDFSRRGGKGGPFDMMVKEMNMTEQQQTEFKNLKEDHFKAIRPVFDSIRTLKQSLFGLVKDESATDSVIANYSNMIASQQSIIDKLTIAHFRKVRAMFSGDQQKKFDDFVQKMMQRKMAGMGRKPGDSSTRKD